MQTFEMTSYVTCVLCNGGVVESVEHLFTVFPLSKPVSESAMVQFVGGLGFIPAGQFLFTSGNKVSRVVGLLISISNMAYNMEGA